mgnify:CR=1 FL=1
MDADYPISRELLHWESQANTAQHHTDGQNLARDRKKRNRVTVPFTYLGPVEMVSHESERPIRMVWRLRHTMAVEMFEDNRRGGSWFNLPTSANLPRLIAQGLFAPTLESFVGQVNRPYLHRVDCGQDYGTRRYQADDDSIGSFFQRRGTNRRPQVKKQE